MVLGCRVLGFGLAVQGFGFRSSGLQACAAPWVEVFGVVGSGYLVGFGCRVFWCWV